MADNLFSRFDDRFYADHEFSLDVDENELISQHVADFIHQHRDELSRFIARKLGSEDVSADILQDAFLRLSSRQSPESIANPRAFVFRIVANLVIDYQRLSVNRLSQDVDDEFLHAIPEDLPCPEKIYQYQQRLGAIHDAIEDLPETCRRVFYMNRVEGYSYSEVAERLNISESMISKHLAQAIKHCRDRLRHY